MSRNTITFINSLASASSLVTFKLTGAPPQPPLLLSLEQGSRVVHDMGQADAPWQLEAYVQDPNSTPPNYQIAPITIDAMPAKVNALSCSAGMFELNGLPVPPSLSGDGTGHCDPAPPGQPGRGRSIFDPAPSDEALKAELEFDIHQQSQSQWCWCTVAACVAKYYNADSAYTQCNLASWAFHACGNCGNCCNASLPDGCNSPSSVMQALEHVGHLRAGTLNGKSFADIKAQIEANQPIGVNVQWNATATLHSVAITGYGHTAGGQTITVKDPANGSTTVMPYAGFPANLGATWFATFTTKS